MSAHAAEGDSEKYRTLEGGGIARDQDRHTSEMLQASLCRAYKQEISQSDSCWFQNCDDAVGNHGSGLF